MGVIRWVDRIDPSLWDRASTRVETLGTDLLERRVAIAFLKEFGRTPSADSVVSTLGDDDPDPELLNGLFEEAVTEETWELDKSLEELKNVAPLLPGGSAFLKIIDFKGIDVEPRKSAAPPKVVSSDAVRARASSTALHLLNGSPRPPTSQLRFISGRRAS
jgi:hypothetical protein